MNIQETLEAMRQHSYFAADAKRIEALYAALRDLVTRCDGQEGVRADGSNICTLAAHAALGDFESGEY